MLVQEMFMRKMHCNAENVYVNKVNVICLFTPHSLIFLELLMQGN